MKDKKELLFEEKRLLFLYRQMLKKEYDINNKNKYENNNELQNHVEMQKAIYLAYNLLWTDMYGFIWDTYGPKSIELEENINKLDNKKEEILKYYNSLDDNIYSDDTIRKLKEYYDSSNVYQLEQFTKLVSDIISEEKGIELLADLRFIAYSQIPGAKFEIANKELQRLRPVFNNVELNKFAFKCLEQYDLINPIDFSKGKVKKI